jgi:hypothetical protein
MVLVIATALAKTLASYLFEGYLKANYGSVEIEGAPKWYGSESRVELCVSTFKSGGLESVELAKEDSKIKLEKKLKDIVSVVITQRFENATQDEKKFLDSVKSDKKVSTFIATHTNYKNIKYDETKKMAFVRNCVLKEEFISYEKVRLKEMVKEMSYYKAGKEFDELDGKGQKFKDSHKDKAFDELNGE